MTTQRHSNREPAQRGDWKTIPMPQECRPLTFQRAYSPADFEIVSMGLIPQEMEDKWFIYYEAPWLYLHRSWTGYCIYKVRFEVCDEIVTVAETLVNRDLAQYTETDDQRDAGILGRLIDALITLDA